MGHTRLGAIPKTRKWNEVVKEIAGAGLTGEAAQAGLNMGAIAAQALEAAQKGLDRAADDPGVLYTFYLMTQVALAARTSDLGIALREHGIRLSNDSTIFDLTASQEFEKVDRWLPLNCFESTADLICAGQFCSHPQHESAVDYHLDRSEAVIFDVSAEAFA